MYIVSYRYNDIVTSVSFTSYVDAMTYYWKNIDKGPSISFKED